MLNCETGIFLGKFLPGDRQKIELQMIPDLHPTKYNNCKNYQAYDISSQQISSEHYDKLVLYGTKFDRNEFDSFTDLSLFSVSQLFTFLFFIIIKTCMGIVLKKDLSKILHVKIFYQFVNIFYCQTLHHTKTINIISPSVVQTYYNLRQCQS